MRNPKISRKEIMEKRPDLFEAERMWTVKHIEEGILPLFWLSSFPVLLNAIANDSKIQDKDLYDKIKKLIEARGFDVSPYKDRNYLGDAQAHEKAFNLYKEAHFKYKISYLKLLAPNVG